MVKESLKYLEFKSVHHPKCEIEECFEYGLSPETGFDCSEFITFLLRQINFPGLDLKIRHCNQYHDYFGIFLHFEGRQPGDLVFFSEETGAGRMGMRPTHMGIVLNDFEYIHAPGSDNTAVRIDELKVTSIPRKYKDQLYFHNPIAFKRLSYSFGRWQKLD